MNLDIFGKSVFHGKAVSQDGLPKKVWILLRNFNHGISYFFIFVVAAKWVKKGYCGIVQRQRF